MADEQKIIEKKPAAKKTAAKAPKADKSAAPRVSEIRAAARFVRATPRKVRLITDMLKGKSVVEARQTLRFVRRDAVRPVVLLINSAIANAEHNFQIDENDLFIKQILVDEGPKLKRYRPRAHGSAGAILYRMSHIALTLGVRPGAKVKTAAPKKTVAPEEVKVVSPDEVKKNVSRTDDKDQGGSPTGSKGNKGFLKGVFQRKTG